MSKSTTQFEKPVEVKPSELASLFAGFKIFENGKDEWIIACRGCNARWTLARRSSHIGNLLYLLNHAASHEPELSDSL